MGKELRKFVNNIFRGKDAYEVVKTIVINFLLFKLLRKLNYIMSREGLRAFITNIAVPYLKKLPMVKKKLDKEVAKTLDDLSKTFSEELTDPRLALPKTGMKEGALLELLEKRKQMDTKGWTSGKITGAVYHGQQEYYDFIGKVYAKWGFANPLHPGIHPSLRQMDSEVVRMIISMYNGGEDCCGAFTTGGTESILMAMKTYRDWARATKGITDPNIVVCTTVHAAFMKAGHYFGIFVKFARATEECEVDVQHMKSLIDSNTVAIVGSCCQYPTGSVDPIEKLAEIAVKKNIGCHVDCCLGGFLVPFMDKAGFPMKPFDFRVKGVTSISCDPHKFGFAPKGASIVMFSSKSLRHHMYSYHVDWSGGIYATPTMTGSRPGGPVAATWAAMCKHGEEGYISTTKQIVGATKAIGEGIRKINELKLVGRPDVCVVAFDATKESGMNCYAIADCMKKDCDWDLATCQNPSAVHLAVTLLSCKNVDLFLSDLKTCIAKVKEDPTKYNSMAGVYGMAASLPPAFLEDGAASYIDAMSEAYSKVPASHAGA
eukprot:TRINITY_DN2631_c0_g1_i2.p1 TRINITY_DN2631_c0_g1~~TRINITY_DN2631_c0_g1_i2.p1  ORF type:complete len:544 (+),score=168.46 TRINITY_DN2631_c0_g1_i2:72-1703(+)